jgi:phospholipase C
MADKFVNYVENGGKMRLILGAHDVPKELWEAYQMGVRSGKDIIDEVARRIAEGLDKIEHFVFIMQENRSFDSYFGTYPGADGIPQNISLSQSEALSDSPES